MIDLIKELEEDNNTSKQTIAILIESTEYYQAKIKENEEEIKKLEKKIKERNLAIITLRG